MFGSTQFDRATPIAMSIGWWYLRRLIRKRGTAAVAGFVAGEGLSFARAAARSAIPFAGSLVLGVARRRRGLFWWRRQQGGGDDWGDWEPVVAGRPARSRPSRRQRRTRDCAGRRHRPGIRARRDVSDGARFVRPSLDAASPGRPGRRRSRPDVASLGLNEGLERAVPVGARGDRDGCAGA